MMSNDVSSGGCALIEGRSGAARREKNPFHLILNPELFKTGRNLTPAYLQKETV